MREINGDYSPHSKLALNIKMTAMKFKQPLNDGQTKSCTIERFGILIIDLLEWSEYALDLILGNADACIRDRYLNTTF